MDRSILEQYASMKAELPELSGLISKLEEGIKKLEEQEVTDSVSCGRRGKKPIRTVKIQGIPMRDITARKQRLQRRKIEYEMLRRKIEETTEAAEAYINGIEDSELRRLLRMRYLQDMQWKSIARCMGRGYTAEACRQKISRFFSLE